MEKVDKIFLSKEFEQKIIDVRKLEAQKHHQNDMYAKPLQNKRKDAVIQLIKNHVKGKSFFDIGCAEGLFCSVAKSYGALYAAGIDAVDEKIVKARAQFPDCKFEVGDVLNLSKTSKYDLVLCSEVLQHIVDYSKCLSKIINTLSRNGIFVLTTPNLSQKNKHLFADIDSEITTEELLNEVGGASFGKQNAIWKFNTKLLCDEIKHNFHLVIIDYIKIGAKPIKGQTLEQAKNIFTIMVFKRK